MTTSDRPITGQAIGRLLRHYRRHLVLQTGVPLALGAGCVAALSWRMWLVGIRPSSIFGVGLAVLAALGWWQRRALQRMWAARLHTPLALDRALGLEARLLTAAEFAGHPHPPPLYGRLMEDPVLMRPLSSMRLSPVANRRTVILAVALLLLLLWPWRAPLPQQLAKQPTPSPTTPPEIPPLPPPQPDPSQPQTAQQPQSGSQQQSSGGSGEQPQSPQQSQQQNGDGQSSQQQDKARGQESGKAQPRLGSADGRDQQKQAGEAGRQEREASQQGAKQGKAGQETMGQRAGQAGSQQTAAAAQEKPGQRDAQLQPGAGSQPLSAAQQGALKADIQQALQQLSTELKHLQAELQQRADQAQPAAGTSTDPELFEDASKLEPASGGPLPIQLDVDTQPTSKTRPGGGVGTPSTEAVDAPFHVEAESAQLADSRTEASVSRRQAIPPEYRPVFERLSTTINE